jgi:hypothetical protein
VAKKDEMARREKIDADRAQETWDGEGGRSPRPDVTSAAESSPEVTLSPLRRVGERRRGDRRR